MQVRIFTLKFNSLVEAFDESELQEFVKDKEILNLREHFFTRHRQPYLTVVVQYQAGPLAAARRERKTGKPREEERWREILEESDRPLFESLRTWRRERSKRAGLPPFIICTNQHLAEIVKGRPESLAALGRIEGFGPAKVEKYGKEILALVAAPVSPPAAGPEPPDETAPATMPEEVNDDQQI